jgi:hypothetical protein
MMEWARDGRPGDSVKGRIGKFDRGKGEKEERMK